MNNLSAWSPKVLSLLRIVSGLLFLQHGLQKMFQFPPKPAPPPGAVAAAAGATKAAAAGAAKAAGASLMGTLAPAAGPIELIGGVLLVIGLFSRPVALICSGEMAFAYFMAHAPRNFYPINNGGAEAIFYCFVFLYFVFSGPGPFSVDQLLKKKI